MNHFPVFTFLGAVTAFTIIPPVTGEEHTISSQVSQELLALKRQTAENKEKIKSLETLLNQRPPKTAPQTEGPGWPPHYLGIPGTNSAIQFILNPNLALTYDFEGPTTDILYPPFVKLKGVSGDANRKGIFTAQAKATQFGFRTLSHTNLGEIKTEISLDFYGQNFEVLPSNIFYQPRLRYAYIELLRFTVGQTASNFIDLDSSGETVDYGGILGVSFRHALVKYALPFDKKTTLSLSAERPTTDYTDNTGALLANSSASMPDLTFQLRHTAGFGYVALRGVLRDLKIRDFTREGQPSFRKTGWGLGISGKFFVYGKSNLFGQYNFGNGIGRYIVICNSQAAFFNPTARIFDLQKASNLIVGFEHFWTEALRSNIIYGYTRINVSRFMPVLTGTIRVTKAFKQYFINLIYSPIPALDVGIEYGQVDRTSVDLRNGTAKRITTGISYKF